MKYKADITALYLNQERISQLLNTAVLTQAASILKGFSGPSGVLSPEGIASSTIAKLIGEWLQDNNVPSLGELFTKDSLPRVGQRFTIYHDFYGNGLPKYASQSTKIPKNAVAQIHNKLRFNSKYRLRIFFHPDNLICHSAWNILGGRSRLFAFAYIEKFLNGEIHARPYVIGDLHSDSLAQSSKKWDPQNYGEVHPSRIDQFSLLYNQPESEKSVPELSLLKSIPEQNIKLAFAEILHEGSVPKDWGGEKSDLFTSNVSLDGRRLPTAFLLKGPAKFSPMTMRHLGKNGDQIERLFNEPADLLILQHCHEVTNPVRATMRAYASRIHDLRYFTILDGYDTIRLMRAYGKCGL